MSHQNCTVMCTQTRQVKVKQLRKSVVLSFMTQEEHNIIVAVWNDMVLRKRLEHNPYSLSRDELSALKTNDQINARFGSKGLDCTAPKAVLNAYK